MPGEQPYRRKKSNEKKKEGGKEGKGGKRGLGEKQDGSKETADND